MPAEITFTTFINSSKMFLYVRLANFFCIKITANITIIISKRLIYSLKGGIPFLGRRETNGE
jgi:hypothetical protein